jgi:hypothetical protein
MAKLQWIAERLDNWARWKLAAGSSSLAHVNLENADMPREAYADAPIPIADCEASDTDDAVERLPGELKATMIEYHLGRGGLRHKLARLCCAESTLHARMERSHRLLADHFMAKQDKAVAERERLKGLQASVRPGFHSR